jgi:hypothetical protein
MRRRLTSSFDLGKDPATGQRRRLTSGFETKRDAEDAMAKAIAEHRDRPAQKEKEPVPTFAEFFARWAASLNLTPGPVLKAGSDGSLYIADTANNKVGG